MCSVCEFCAGFSTVAVIEILKVKTHGSSSSTGRKLPVCQTPSVVLRVVQFYNIHIYFTHPTTTAVCEVIITKNKEENDDLFEWFADTSTLLQLSSSEQEKNQQLHSNNTNNIGKVCCCFFMLGCGCLSKPKRRAGSEGKPL